MLNLFSKLSQKKSSQKDFSLHSIKDLQKIDDDFLKLLHSKSQDLYLILQEKRLKKTPFTSPELISLSIIVDEFLLAKYKIQHQSKQIQNIYQQSQTQAWIKRNIIIRIASKKYKQDEIMSGEFDKFIDYNSCDFDFDKTFCELINLASKKQYLDIMNGERNKNPLFSKIKNHDNIKTDAELYDILIKYAAFASITKQGRILHKDSSLFNIPQKIDFMQLFDFNKIANVITSMRHKLFVRSNFKFYDKKPSNAEITWQTKYCIYCHKQQNDYCRTGFDDFAQGCPLDQKISEMNYTKANGYIISPIAIAMIDNPFVLLTGRRICNDCVKSCIYQKTDAVDTPSIETACVDDLLSINYGFEIYNLLTLWNPLKTKHFIAENLLNNKNILVVGSGVAGIAISHYLTFFGANVSIVDGQKIEGCSEDHLHTQIVDCAPILNKDLEDIIVDGFGGVMNYGITARWNKNLLTLAKIILFRRKKLKYQGGVRFCSDESDLNALTISKAKSLGFDFVCLATGAGKPKMDNKIEGMDAIKNGLLTSSNFLMSLHSSHAFKSDCKILNIQSPVVVLGAGLTAIDCASEAMAFCNSRNQNNVSVKIIYHRSIQESAAYRLNHLELEECLAQDIEFLQNCSVVKISVDSDKNVNGVYLNDGSFMPAKTIITAFGTEYNNLQNQNFVEILGDANKDYAGSVVKALANAKNVYENIVERLKKECKDNNKIKPLGVSAKIYSIKNVSDNIYKVVLTVVCNSAFAINILDICKIQSLGERGKPFAATIAGVHKNKVWFYLQKSGSETTNFISNCRKNDDILFMPSGKSINFSEYKHINFIVKHSSARHFALINAAKTLKHCNIYTPNNKDDFFDIYHKLLTNCKSDELIYILEHNFEFDEDNFTNNADTFNVIKQINDKFKQTSKAKTLYVFNAKMQCMLKGVCSKCLIINNGVEIYTCKENFTIIT